MPPPLPPEVNGWDHSTLKIYFERIIADLEKRVDARFMDRDKAIDIANEARDRALSVATNANERRLEGLNELRSMANEQAAKFVTRIEYEAKQQNLIERVETLQTTVTANIGRTSGSSMLWASILAVIGTVALVADVIAHFVVKG